MNVNKRFWLRNLISTALIVVLSLCLVFTVACSNSGDNSSSADSTSGSNSSSSSSTTVSKTDHQVITNGDFEFGTDDTDAGNFPVASSVSWTRSNDSLLNSAKSSSKKSGIIDTDPEVYKEIAASQEFPVIGGEGEDKVYFNPGTPEKLGFIGEEDLYVYDEDVENENKLPTSGSKILMIHNVTGEEGRGTAQKFTSTKTFDVKSYAKVSVWVKTKDLKTVQETEEFGAYVALRTTIDTEASPVIVKNINTNGQWIKLNFFVAASDYASTKMRVVLGLGFGSEDVRREYVEGFAYFDNVTFTEISKDEYEEYLAQTDNDNRFEYYEDGDQDDVYELKAELEKYSMAGKEAEDNGEQKYSEYNFSVNCATPAKKYPILQKTQGALNENYLYSGEIDNYGEGYEAGVKAFEEIECALMTDVENPVQESAATAYILHPTNASSTLTIKDFKVEDGQTVCISFYVRAETYMHMTGLAVGYKEHAEGQDTTDIKTSSLLSAFTTKDYENADSKNFAKVRLYFTNDVGDGNARYFDLVFTLGTTDMVTDYMKLTKGEALLTGFERSLLNKTELGKMASDSYTATAQLGSDMPNGIDAEEENEDVYSFNYAQTNKTTISSKPADNVIGYTGIVGDHTVVGGEQTAYVQDATTVAGIINTKYDYAALADEIEAIRGLEKDGDNANLQPLVIKNVTVGEKKYSYGYVSTAKTISAGSTALVSVKVKVIGNATAYVYLVNADALAGFDVLDLTAYEYDAQNHERTDTAKFTKSFVQTVNAEDSADGWVTVNFLVTAGENDIEYRVELWNGSRDGKEGSEGTVIFDKATTSSMSDTTTFMAKLKEDSKQAPAEESYTRIPTKVNYTDENGNAAVRYKTYPSTVVYSEYADAKTVIASYSTIDVTSEETIEDEEEEETDSSDESEADQSANTIGWLQITSIIIAAVLVLVLIVIGVRMILKKTKKEKATSEIYYSRDSREKAQRQINENKARREAAARNKAAQAEEEASAEEQPEEQAEEEQPAEEQPEEQAEETPAYDYENMENNIPDDVKDEEKPE